MEQKIKSYGEIDQLLSPLRKEGKRIVHCHGVFDLLHPGHIRHFQEAKSQGDALVVTITPDRFVNKGPGRPAFNEKLRLQSLAALASIDFVVLNDAPDAVSAIERIKPHVYIKGAEYKEHTKDVTGKIVHEAKAIEECGGVICYTSDDVVFSSSSLLNRHFDPASPEVLKFIDRIKSKCSIEDLLATIESFKNLKVLVVGDAIIDEYQYVETLGQSGKGIHLTARCLDKEVFLGGALIIANHLAQFSDHVTLLTAVGRHCPHRDFITQTLEKNVNGYFLEGEDVTLTKKRYVIKDDKQLTKLFETYSTNRPLLSAASTDSLCAYINEHAESFDLVLVADFGNGFTNPAIIDALSSVNTCLAINTQTNSGNRGYNVVTHYKRADFVSLNEAELRLAAHDRINTLGVVLSKIAERLSCPHISVTRGVAGVLCFDQEESVAIPAFTTSVVDRVGAGDSYFALAALAIAKGCTHEIAGFIGSLAASINVQIVGNKESVSKSALSKYLIRLMK